MARPIDDLRSKYSWTEGLTDLEVADRLSKHTGRDPRLTAFDLGVELPNAPGFGTSFKNSLYSTAQGVGQLAGDFIPGVGNNNALELYGRAGTQRNPVDIMDGEGSALSNFGRNLMERPGNVVGQIAGQAVGFIGPSAAARVGVAGLNAVRGAQGLGRVGKAALGATDTALFGLPSYGTMRDEQEAKGDNELSDKLRAAGSALAIGKIEKGFGVESALAGNPVVGKGLFRTIGKQAVGEAGEEIAQAPFEQFGSNNDVFTRQTLDNALAGGAVGLLGGAMAGPAVYMMRDKPLSGTEPTDLLNYNTTNPDQMTKQALATPGQNYDLFSVGTTPFQQTTEQPVSAIETSSPAGQMGIDYFRQPNEEREFGALDLFNKMTGLNRKKLTGNQAAIMGQVYDAVQSGVSLDEFGPVIGKVAKGGGLDSAQKTLNKTIAEIAARDAQPEPVQQPVQEAVPQVQPPVVEQPVQPEPMPRNPVTGEELPTPIQQGLNPRATAKVATYKTAAEAYSNGAITLDQFNETVEKLRSGKDGNLVGRQLNSLIDKNIKVTQAETRAVDRANPAGAVRVLDGQGNEISVVAPAVNNRGVKGGTVAESVTPFDQIPDSEKSVVGDFMGYNQNGAADEGSGQRKMTIKALSDKYGVSKRQIQNLLNKYGYTEATRISDLAAFESQPIDSAPVNEDATAGSVTTVNGDVISPEDIELGNLRISNATAQTASGSGETWRSTFAKVAKSKQGLASRREGAYVVSNDQLQAAVESGTLSQAKTAEVMNEVRRRMGEAAASNAPVEGIQESPERQYEREKAAAAKKFEDEETQRKVEYQRWWMNIGAQLVALYENKELMAAMEKEFDAYADQENSVKFKDLPLDRRLKMVQRVGYALEARDLEQAEAIIKEAHNEQRRKAKPAGSTATSVRESDVKSESSRTVQPDGKRTAAPVKTDTGGESATAGRPAVRPSPVRETRPTDNQEAGRKGSDAGQSVPSAERVELKQTDVWQQYREEQDKVRPAATTPLSKMLRDAQNTKQIAEWLSKNASKPFNRLIAKKLIPLLGSNTKVYTVTSGVNHPDGIPASMQAARALVQKNYETGDYRMFVRDESFKENGANEETLVHELLHDALMRRIRDGNIKSNTNAQLAAAIKDLYALSNKVIAKYNEDFKAGITPENKGEVRNALSNVDELISWGLTNEKVQDYLRKVRVDGQSVWNRMVELFRRVLGLGKYEGSALDELLRVTDAVIRAGEAVLPEPSVGMDTKTGTETRAQALTGATVPDRTTARRLAGDLGVQAVDDLAAAGRAAMTNVSWLHNLIQDAVKAGMQSAQKWYTAINESQKTRFSLERAAEDIGVDFSKLTHDQQTRTNKFIADSTVARKWGFKPDFKNEFGELYYKDVAVDPALEAQFKKLSAQEQKIAKAVFKHGRDMIEQKFSLMKKLGIEDKLFNKTGMIDGPYAPLKRFGNWVAVIKSSEVIDLEKQVAERPTKELEQKLEQLKRDEKHYIVSYFDSNGQAAKFARDNHIAGGMSDAFKRDEAYDFGGSANYQTFQRIMSDVANDLKLNPEVREALTDTVKQLYLRTVEDTNSRMMGARRKDISGFEKDMMRSFLAAARADAAFVANLKHGEEINQAFTAMRKEAKNESGQFEHKYLLDAIGEHYRQNALYKDTPIQDALVGLTSMWQLSTSIGYHLQNFSQTAMVSVPKLVGDFGNYGNVWGKVFDGYKVASRVIEKGRADFSKLDKESQGLKNTLEELKLLGLADVGQQEDLSRLDMTKTGYGIIDRGATGFAKISYALHSVARTVELYNRVSTATAAYNLHFSKFKDAEAAKQYAVQAVRETQGDFSRTAAPLLLKKLPKPVVQYRKYQFMMAALYSKAFKDVKWGSAEEKAVAKRFLIFKLFHTSAAAGVLGWPLMNIAAAAWAMLGGDDDEPADMEQAVRDYLGDTPLATAVMKGIPAALGLDMSTKMSDRGVFAISPVADFDFSSGQAGINTLGNIAFGPAGSQFSRTLDGINLIGEGQVYKGIEKFLPTGLADAMKGFRMANEGYSMRNGDIVVTPDDISGAAILLQTLSLPATEIKEIQRVNGLQYEIRKFYTDRTSEIQRKYAMAYRDGDTDTMSDMREQWMTLQDGKDNMRQYFNDSPEYLKRQPLSNLLKYPEKVDKREKRERSAVYSE